MNQLFGLQHRRSKNLLASFFLPISMYYEKKRKKGISGERTDSVQWRQSTDSTQL